jgi:tRNA-specific 2-thiouridylase
VSERLFVTDVDPQTRRVTVGPEAALYQREVRVSKVNYIGGNPPSEPIQVTAKIRYNGLVATAMLSPGPDQLATLQFDDPQRAVTPGQAAVFFDGDRVLGGGQVV